MKNCLVVLGLLVIGATCAERTLAQGPNYVGFVDRVDCNRMAGWAADRNRPNVPINVSIYVDGNASPLMTVLANTQREPAVGQFVGSGDNGQHGFDFGQPLRDGQPHTFTLKFESSSALVNAGGGPNPASLTCGAFDAGTATIDVLIVDFKLNSGAASVRNRLAGLSFSVRESTGANSHDVTSEVTHYRLRESPDLGNADLSVQPWTPLPQHALIMELAERNGAGRRYGERKVMFQVKTAKLTSPVVSDTITLEPVLKQYRVSASGGVHPLIQYAASQGFTFPLSFYETCNGNCKGGVGADPGLDTGTANVLTQVATTSGGGGNPGGANPNLVTCVAAGAVIGGVAASVPGAVIGAAIGGLACGSSQPAPGISGSCITKADYILFDGRSPNQFWTIKSVSVSDSEVFVRYHGANKFLLKFIHEPKDATCSAGRDISIGDVVVEGPEVDDFVDAANPWKNAFVRPTLRLIQPSVVPRPN